MRAEIIAVGTELLLGDIVNSNAQEISAALASAGVDVMFHTVVGDNEQRIAQAISTGLERSDVVIITGGLGPTHDDLTREAISRVTGRPLQERADLVEWLRDRFARMGREMAASNLRQAQQPEGAVAIPNPRGTAPGVFVDHDGRSIYAVPGVPLEMRGMLEDRIIPDLRERAGGTVLVSRVLHVVGLGESDVAQRISEVITDLDRKPGATIALLTSVGEVRVRISAKGGNRNAAFDLIAPVEKEVREILGGFVFGTDGQSLELVVSNLMKAKGLTLAIAESVTGGLVSSRIVDIPGASEFLLASYVAYSMNAKEQDLGVSADTLASHGPVSAETALAMALGARTRSKADVAIATTGEAGPDSVEVPIGTVYVALSSDQASLVRNFIAPGGRGAIRIWAAQAAINLLRLWLIGEVR